MTNPPRELWEHPELGSQFFAMSPSTRYNFILTVSDPGGVARAFLAMSIDYDILTVSPDTVVLGRSSSGFYRTFTLLGSRGDSREALVMVGSFRTPATANSKDFLVRAEDFGGRSGVPNRRSMQVNVTSGIGIPP